ncbi:MAG TPA: exosortase/archaeosortase family protein [Armatimonadota bacterium]|jgi:exosortase
MMVSGKTGSSGLDPSGRNNSIGMSGYAAVIACGVLACLLVMPVLKHWYKTFTATESYYSHGLLIPFLCAAIIWMNRKNLSLFQVNPSAWGYLVVIPSLIAVVVGIWVPALSITGLFIPILLWGMALLLLGTQIARGLLFPAIYMYFMCPLPSFMLAPISFKIRVLSTLGATAMLKSLSFHVVQLGTMITLPNGVIVSVESPCSGFRFLISLFALAVLYAYVTDGPKWGKIALVSLMLPLSVILNGFRIMTVAVVGNYWGSDTMVSFHDNWAGLIMMLLGFVSLYLFSRLFKCGGFNSTLSF